MPRTVQAKPSELPQVEEVQETPPVDTAQSMEKEPATASTASTEELARQAGYLTLIAGLNGGWLGPLIPSMARAQNLPLEQVGLITSFLCGGAFLSQILGPGLIARLSSRKTLILGSSLLGLGMLSLGQLNGLWALLCAASIMGFGTGLNGIAAHVSILTYFRERAASALSKLNIFYGIGALAAPQIVQLSGASQGIGYRYLLSFASALSLLVLVKLFSLPMAEASQSKQTEKAEERQEEILTLPLVLTCLVIFLYVGTETAMATWLFTYILNCQTKSTSLASLSVTALFGGLTVGRLISIKVSSIFTSARVTVTAMLVMVVSLFFLAGLREAAVPALILTFCAGLGCGPVFPR
ncbi:MAG: MFS transporter [Candidatus Competibacteraceae bacterium]|nr:MFS transporter [Candidatus Competibacteraceae bacterium]